MATQYISVSDAAFRTRRSYRQTLDDLFSGKLRGRRQGRNWQVSLASVQELEREFGLVQEDGAELDRAS